MEVSEDLSFLGFTSIAFFKALMTMLSKRSSELNSHFSHTTGSHAKPNQRPERCQHTFLIKLMSTVQLFGCESQKITTQSK